MNWLFYLIAGLATALALFLSKPEKRVLAWITVFLIFLPSGWQAYNAYQTQRTNRELQEHLTKKLSGKTNSFLTLIRDMIFYSSDGWMPKTETDFFSSKSVDLICNHLNIDATAPVLPERTWRKWIAKQAKDYKMTLNHVLVESSGALDADLVRKISMVESSPLLSVLPNSAVVLPAIDRKYGWKRPPLLCPGAENLVEKELNKIYQLYREVRKQEEKYDISKDWNFLVMHSDNRWPKKLLGKDRFNSTLTKSE